jgi:hypothetical protein
VLRWEPSWVPCAAHRCLFAPRARTSLDTQLLGSSRRCFRTQDVQLLDDLGRLPRATHQRYCCTLAAV